MKREKLQQLAHLVAGIFTLVYGFDAFEAGDFSSATSYLSLAIVFLIVAGTHQWISGKFLQSDVAFYLVEAATIIYSALNYKMKGHPYLFYIMAAAAMCYLIFAIISLFTEERPKRHSKRRKRRRHASSLFDEKRLSDDNDLH